MDSCFPFPHPHNHFGSFQSFSTNFSRPNCGVHSYELRVANKLELLNLILKHVALEPLYYVLAIHLHPHLDHCHLSVIADSGNWIQYGGENGGSRLRFVVAAVAVGELSAAVEIVVGGWNSKKGYLISIVYKKRDFC